MITPTVEPPTTLGAPLDPADFAAALAFAAWMTGSRDRGLGEVDAAIQRADGPGLEPVLVAIVRSLGNLQRFEKPVDFAGMDRLLRSQSTVHVPLDHPLVQGEPARLRVLHAEMRRACLSATLRALPVAPRAAFVLIEILGWSFDQAVRVLGGHEAVRTALSRATRQLDSYLGARCEHLNRGNFCHCTTRLGLGLERGLVTWPEEHADHLAAEGRTFSAVGPLYASLPAPA